MSENTLNAELASRTIIVTRRGEFGHLNILFRNARQIVDGDDWGSRYYAPDNETETFIELEYFRHEVGGDVIHTWHYAQSVVAEPVYMPGDMKPIEEIRDSEHKYEPSYFKELGKEVKEANPRHIKRGDQYALYVETNDSEIK